MLALAALTLPELCQAVLFYSTGDPTHNTTAPAGALTDSGWQYEGEWLAELGTRFYRLQACAPLRITDIRVHGAMLVLSYQ